MVSSVPARPGALIMTGALKFPYSVETAQMPARRAMKLSIAEDLRCSASFGRSGYGVEPDSAIVLDALS